MLQSAPKTSVVHLLLICNFVRGFCTLNLKPKNLSKTIKTSQLLKKSRFLDPRLVYAIFGPCKVVKGGM